jgi:amidase
VGIPLSGLSFLNRRLRLLISIQWWPGYTEVWNFLDYSALALPVSCVSQDTDRIYPSYQPRNAVDEWNWGLYDPERMHGHPVGVQIVGRRLEEEKVLAAARVFEDLLQSSVDHRSPC